MCAGYRVMGPRRRGQLIVRHDTMEASRPGRHLPCAFAACLHIWLPRSHTSTETVCAIQAIRTETVLWTVVRRGTRVARVYVFHT